MSLRLKTTTPEGHGFEFPREEIGKDALLVVGLGKFSSCS